MDYIQLEGFGEAQWRNVELSELPGQAPSPPSKFIITPPVLRPREFLNLQHYFQHRPHLTFYFTDIYTMFTPSFLSCATKMWPWDLC